MPRILLIAVALSCHPVFGQEAPADPLEHINREAAEARKAAAANPEIVNAASPPVKAYLAEQQRRRLLRLDGLRQRIGDYAADASKASLLPVLKQQLADLESKPLDEVSFDSAYGYSPSTGLLGYSRKVRLLENTPDGKSIILVDNVALLVEGLGTSDYASGKFFSVDKAFLIGAARPAYSFQGSDRKSFSARLIDLNSLLNAAKPAIRPNVLMIVIDDLNTDLGCYGVPDVLSPNIDRLAKQGVRFDRAYCQYAVCAPSRWSFLSGLRPETTGIFDFQTLLRQKMPDVVFLPQLFRNNGYFTAGMGKVFHDERRGDAESWDFYQDGAPEDEQEAEALRFRYSQKEGAREFTPFTRLAGPEEKTRDGTTARGIARMLSVAVRDGKPFFLAAGFHKPHLPWTAPKKYYELYDARPFPEPRDPSLIDIPAIALMTELVGNPPPPRLEAIRAYAACISFIDAQVGLLLQALDRDNLWDNTVVVLFSDHGYHLGDHDGLWAKFTVFDRGCRVPLIIAAPGCAKDAVSPRTVELTDLYPTLAELSGLTPPGNLDGRSLVPLLKQPEAAWNRPAHSRVHHEGVTGRSVRVERWRYTEWDGGQRGVELYDHQNDPGEYRNLAGKPEHAAAIAELKRLLLP